MGESTAISWTDHTFNPWWGCTRVSEACRNCYAESWDARFNGGHWGPTAPRKFFGDKHWNEPRKWNRAAQRDGVIRRVFCASMADVFEDRRDLDAQRARLWQLIRETPNLDWLLLTKRPEAMARMLPWVDNGTQIAHPWRNVWCGVTAEDNDRAEQRILTLRAIPAAIRFVSCEPILEPIGADTWDLVFGFHRGGELGPVHWLIVGDESGHDRRPASLEWIRAARDAATRHEIAFHFKQWNSDEVLLSGDEGIWSPDGVSPDGPKKKIHLPMLDGRQWAEFPAGRSV